MKQKLLIYYVDDDTDDLFFLAEIAAASGHKIETFKSGDTLLSVLKYVYPTPDLIFIDENMPGMSGTEVLREIKNMPDLKHIPSIMVTGFCTMSGVDSFLKAGANHVVEKANSKSEFEEIFHNVEQIDWDIYCPVLQDFIYR